MLVPLPLPHVAPTFAYTCVVAQHSCTLSIARSAQERTNSASRFQVNERDVFPFIRDQMVELLREQLEHAHVAQVRKLTCISLTSTSALVLHQTLASRTLAYVMLMRLIEAYARLDTFGPCHHVLDCDTRCQLH